MGVFDGIEHVFAEGTSSRQYFAPGNYLVTIETVILHEKRLGGKLFIVETTVNESSNPSINPGEQRNWVQSLALPSALPRIKSFIGAAHGFCPRTQSQDINTQITSAICEICVGPKAPLRGKKLRLSCVAKTTKSGKEFIQHVWGI